MQIAGQSSLSLAVLKALGAQTAPAAAAAGTVAAPKVAASAGDALAAPDGLPDRPLPRGSFVDLRV